MPAPAPAKPKTAPEVTNGTVQVSFSDDPAPAKTIVQAAAAPEIQTPAPAKSEPVAVQTTAQPVTFNPKPEPKVETVAASTAKSKPSAGVPVNNTLASSPEPATVAKNDPPVLNTASPSSAPESTTTTASTSTTA